MDDRLSWQRYQPGMSGMTAPQQGEDVTQRRYELEPHILEVVPFDEMNGTVVELGCGIGTDGLRISANAHRYIGVDYSSLGLRKAAQRHHERAHESSGFVRSDLRSLPFASEMFDFAYSHGVVHHIREDELVWAELRRILKPNGRFCVMVYHRQSVNYHYGIRILRRAALMLALGFRPLASWLARSRHESDDTVAAHLSNFKEEGARYLVGERWLSANTDGPSNTYSRVYSRRELQERLETAGLVVDTMRVRYLNPRVNPPLGLLPQVITRAIAKRAGWHLYAIGHRP